MGLLDAGEEAAMKRMSLIVLVAIVVAACGGSGAAENPGSGGTAAPESGRLLTARDAVEVAATQLGDFATGAVLVKVSTYPSPEVHADGTAVDWKVTYWSRSAGEQLDVIVRNGNVESADTATQSMQRSAVEEGWLDSPAAIAAMGDHCASAPDGSFFLMLFEAGDGPQWGVTCGTDDGEQSGRVDARTGELIAAWPGRWDEEPSS